MPEPPQDQLALQPLPTKRDSRPSGTFPGIYGYPPIPPAAADAARRFYPTPAEAQPVHLFSVRLNMCSAQGFRFIRKTNRKQALMFIDGACSNNGAPDAKGGCGVVYTSIHEAPGIALPLERDGQTQTNNRAELRAALLAIGLRRWSGEGFDDIVLACDSEYVVRGVSEWLQKWESCGWKTARGEKVKNRDLWEALRGELRYQEKGGVLVQFWLIPRGLNEADKFAKDATTRQGREGAIQKIELLPFTKSPSLMTVGHYGAQHDGNSSQDETDIPSSEYSNPDSQSGEASTLWQTRGDALAEEYEFTSTGDDEMDTIIAMGLQDMRDRGEID